MLLINAETGEHVEVPDTVISRCPNVILDPTHYMDDYPPCECYNKGTDMEKWGYIWDEEEGHWL